MVNDIKIITDVNNTFLSFKTFKYIFNKKLKNIKESSCAKIEEIQEIRYALCVV